MLNLLIASDRFDLKKDSPSEFVDENPSNFKRWVYSTVKN